MKLPFTVHPKIIFDRGLELAGKPSRTLNKTNLTHFRSHYGASPGVVAILWTLIQDMLRRRFSFVHLLWALMFMKVYATESVLAGKLGVDDDTFRTHIWPIIKKYLH
mmetsp:Transcript_13127/g.24666  ORF Transcript_13127/g.24666 Transcript_13127/m.24666 type:complete len:107 (+) Transcript_13127:291-611(+)